MPEDKRRQATRKKFGKVPFGLPTSSTNILNILQERITRAIKKKKIKKKKEGK
jgi:hypothetical protein